jgi:hypothetical protein
MSHLPRVHGPAHRLQVGPFVPHPQARGPAPHPQAPHFVPHHDPDFNRFAARLAAEGSIPRPAWCNPRPSAPHSASSSYLSRSTVEIASTRELPAARSDAREMLAGQGDALGDSDRMEHGHMDVDMDSDNPSRRMNALLQQLAIEYMRLKKEQLVEHWRLTHQEALDEGELERQLQRLHDLVEADCKERGCLGLDAFAEETREGQDVFSEL